MRTIYLDSDFKCHVTDDGTFASFETDFFDGKCDTFIEGYRFVPAGEVWTRPAGVVFTGEMISPHMDYAALDKAQRAYEQQQLAQYEAALSEIETALGVNT